MVKLAGAISTVFVDERGTDEFLKHLSDPYWFQCLSCVLGFDWHSSGTTTVTCHALSRATEDRGLGIRVLGGKGIHSRKVPGGITRTCEEFGISSQGERELVRTSRLTAKIDSGAVQDGYDIYHHSFLLTEKGRWAVIQQGMNVGERYARRYHWLDEEVGGFLRDPHRSVVSGARSEGVLNLSATASGENREVQMDLVNDGGRGLRTDIEQLMGLSARERLPRDQSRLDNFSDDAFEIPEIDLPDHIPTLDMPRRINWKTLRAAYEIQPDDYEEMMLVPSMGGRTMRALSLVAELIYGEPASWKDPVRYSFALGGKDGVPYPVDRESYDTVVDLYSEAIEESALGSREKLRRLGSLRACAPPPM